MTDFSEMQRRILKRVLAGTEKKDRVEKYLARLQQMKQKVLLEADESHKQARSIVRQLQTELNKVEEALLAHLKRVERANLEAIAEQGQFCESLVADIEEGLALAKDFLAENKEESESKPLQVIQSVEVGLDELQEATIKKKPVLQPFGVIDPTPVFAAFQNMSFRHVPGILPAVLRFVPVFSSSPAHSVDTTVWQAPGDRRRHRSGHEDHFQGHIAPGVRKTA